jgi:glycosidase
MLHWIKNENIDGFRCDVASNVPLDFWQQAIPQLRKEKNIFMLAEAWEPELLKEGLFDMAYNWEGHHTMNRIAQGKNTVKDWDKFMTENERKYSADDILMNFVDNHDENSWNGTVKGRLGKAEEAMTALSYVMPGMPLIYSGNEYGLNHSLKFFEKDLIPKVKGREWELLQKLGKLKNDNSSLSGGKQKAIYKKIEISNPNILAFERTKDGKKIIYLANLSNDVQGFENSFNQSFTDYINNKKFDLSSTSYLKLKPWEYFILVN